MNKSFIVKSTKNSTQELNPTLQAVIESLDVEFESFAYSSPLEVATNQKVNKTFKTLTYSLFPFPCSLKSSIIFAMNTHRIAID